MNFLKFIKNNVVPNIIYRLPYFRGIKKYITRIPPGHYYSSLPNSDDIQRASEWAKSNSKVQGIDFNTDSQISLLLNLSNYYHSVNYTDTESQQNRFYFQNNYFQYSDAFLLQCLILEKKPQIIIEIGSGFSSALLLDINDNFFKGELELNFIEPFPEERLSNLMKESDFKNDKVKVYKDLVQNIDISLFHHLERNDLLFVDSSHISKAGSDLNFIIFEILPILKPGVLIHFHDIFYPFEYPEAWLKSGFFWNENYLLRAFLMFNKNFEILFFNTYLVTIENEFVNKIRKECPLFFEFKTGSIWLTKKY